MATAICSYCGKTTSAEAAQCAHCGLKRQPPTRRNLHTPVVCPGCGKTMELVWLASLQVDVCPACQGVWFDKGELVELPQRITCKELADAAAEVLGRFTRRADAFRRPSYLQCPVCAGHMTRSNYREVSGILTDHCPSCGTWLDQQSITRVLRLVASNRLAEIDERAARTLTSRPPTGSAVDRSDGLAALELPVQPVDLAGSDDADRDVDMVRLLIDILGGMVWR